MERKRRPKRGKTAKTDFMVEARSQLRSPSLIAAVETGGERGREEEDDGPIEEMGKGGDGSLNLSSDLVH